MIDFFGVDRDAIPLRGDSLLLDVRDEEAEGTEDAGTRRYDHLVDPELAGHLDGERRPSTAEGDNDEVARIAPALAGDSTDGLAHVGDGYRIDAVGSVGDAQSERGADVLLYRASGRFGIDMLCAAGDLDRIDV